MGNNLTPERRAILADLSHEDELQRIFAALWLYRNASLIDLADYSASQIEAIANPTEGHRA